MPSSPRLYHQLGGMVGSNQSSAAAPLPVTKEKRAKNFYEHGKDALALALSVADMQEEKALRKTERHHQPQVGKPGPERKNRDRTGNKRKRLEEAKIVIAKRRADAKKEKAKSRNESKSRQRQCPDSGMTALEDTASAAPRKRVSFA